MQEVVIKNNNTGLRVFITGAPDLKLIPEEIAENTVTSLELQISEHYGHKRKEKNIAVK